MKNTVPRHKTVFTKPVAPVKPATVPVVSSTPQLIMQYAPAKNTPFTLQRLQQAFVAASSVVPADLSAQIAKLVHKGFLSAHPKRLLSKKRVKGQHQSPSVSPAHQVISQWTRV